MPIFSARAFISRENAFSSSASVSAAAFAASLPEDIIIPAARSFSVTFSPVLRYIELPSAIMSSVNVTTSLPFAACSSVRSVVISFVVLAGFIRLPAFFSAMISPLSAQ